MTQEPYDQNLDDEFMRIVTTRNTPHGTHTDTTTERLEQIEPEKRHPLGRTYQRGNPWASFIGCAGLIVVVTLAVIAVILVWRMSA